MKSVMKHNFSQVPSMSLPRSVFDRSHGYKTAFNEGYLIPFLVDEALPGDTIKCNATILARLASPLLAPIMDNIKLDTFFFAVPNRLLWDNWQKFCGEQDTPGASTDYTVPYLESPATGWTERSVPDYMGIPTKVNAVMHTNALFTRAYNLIWNEWFRDQNLQSQATVDTDDGPDAHGDYSILRKRGKRHDYFTSCLPWPQKGDAVDVPLTGNLDIYGNGMSLGLVTNDSNQPFGMHVSSGSSTGRDLGGSDDDYNVTVGSTPASESLTGNSMKSVGVVESGESGLYGDLSSVSAVTINALRLAFQTQKMLERDARGGTRYVEVLRSHFGVVSPDFRLQRPEYLGGGKQVINVSQVQQNSQTDAALEAGGTATPMGSLAAYGVGFGNRNSFSKSFTEHCTIIGLVCAHSDITYQQGLDRMFSRGSRYDYYWPAFAHLGEQAVLSREIYLDGTSGDLDVFGYQERWAEYRYKPSHVTSTFRSNATTSLDFWHLSQEFTSRPELNNAFIKVNSPINRVSAVETQHFILDAFFDYKAARAMPVYSVPGMIDHF